MKTNASDGGTTALGKTNVTLSVTANLYNSIMITELNG